MQRSSPLKTPLGLSFCAPVLLQAAACTGYINDPTPQPSPSVGATMDRACPTIGDQDTSVCPRLKNISLSCGGNGMLHTRIGGGSGKPILIEAQLDSGSVLSAVIVVVNCQDGPRESVTFGVTYTGEVSTPPAGPPCIRQSKTVYSQFQFANPIYAGFEGLAKTKLHQALDDEAIGSFASKLGIAAPAASRCSVWREMP